MRDDFLDHLSDQHDSLYPGDEKASEEVDMFQGLANRFSRTSIEAFVCLDFIMDAGVVTILKSQRSMSTAMRLILVPWSHGIPNMTIYCEALEIMP